MPSLPEAPRDTVAIIMRTRDRPVFLARALQSVLDQDFQQWHLIIVNDGDMATVDAVLDPFLPALKGRSSVLHRAATDGPRTIGKLTNTGLQDGNTRWVTLLDDDDTWQPTFLSRTLAMLTTSRRHPDVRGVVTQTMQINEALEGETLRQLDAQPFNPGLRRIELMSLAAANLFTCNAFVYERSVLSEIGLYDETLPVLDDWEFNLRFARRFDIDVITEPLANYHHRRAAPGTAGTALNTAREQHEFFHNKIVNDQLRADLDAGQSGLGWLMAVSGRLRAVSEKVGRIENQLRRAAKPLA